MTRLTAAISYFALSAIFAWISSTTSGTVLTARAHASEAGLSLLLRQPVADYGVAEFAMFCAFLMLLIGIGCLIASMIPRRGVRPAPMR